MWTCLLYIGPIIWLWHYRRFTLLQIMLSLICMPTMHSDIPKYAGNKSVFCSTVTAQIKPWEEIVGRNVTTRPTLKAKSGRTCTILWWKRPIICVGLIYANKQCSLEFPTDQPGIHPKTRELVKDLCRGTPPPASRAWNTSCPASSLTRRSRWRLFLQHQTGREGEREISAGFAVGWSLIQAKSASDQTPFAASLSSATRLSQPGSSTLLRPAATTESWNNNQLLCHMELLWSVLALPLVQHSHMWMVLVCYLCKRSDVPGGFRTSAPETELTRRDRLRAAASRYVNTEMALPRQQ